MAYIKKAKKITYENDDKTIYSVKELLEFAREKAINTEPLDVAALAHQLDLTVRYEPMSNGVSGSLKKDKKTNRWIITVNSLHHPHRQRFTIAHELCHFFKHIPLQDEFSDEFFFRGSKFSPMEKEANNFAAELLMPEESFRKQVLISNKVEDIAKYFQVSSAAVVFRSKELGYKGE